MSSTRLATRIRDEIARSGPITFARYMALALYDPTDGYYTTAVRVGRHGDYLTAPEAHPIFGWVIARQLEELWELGQRPVPFTVIEYGPATGSLALAVFERLTRTASPLLECLQYWPVEISCPAREQLVARLEASGVAGLLRLDGESSVTGVVLANEVLDALPVHRVRRHNGQLWEVYVDWNGERFVEILGPLSRPKLQHWLERLGVELVEGQTTELSLAVEDWLADVDRRLQRGYVLVLDYGYPVPERYDPVRFPDGTLRTYVRHTVGDDPFDSPGARDITAPV
ncbi:MAG: SAM-dependent methyltransferase, partial [Thermomicrobium sp.]|nr:SAM-dependent methyltransferase [Thermomicrobium sp.]